MCEVLAERPMLVEQRHAGRGIGIEHLLRGDHLDLVRIGVEPEFGSRNLLARIVDALQAREIPVGRLAKQSVRGVGHRVQTLSPSRRRKSSRNTGKISDLWETLRMESGARSATSFE